MESEWFDNVANKSDRYMTVFDEPTQSNLKLHAYYFDNNSDKTVVVHHGYRSTAKNSAEEIKFFYEQGYNVIAPNARSHGQSEGSYISFGAYEKSDVNRWIDQELALKPNQKIILMGVSMGAATVMMSQEKPHSNVQAIIEDCGYYSIEQQARDVMRLLTSKLQYIPLVNQIDWYEFEDELVDTLNDNYVKPILKVDLYSISPLDAVKTSNVPKLFIHGTDDWFIPPVAKDKLYAASLGYKEQLSIPGSGHAENLKIGGNMYKDKVISFLATVEQMAALRPQLAVTENLLKNTEFKRNQNQTSFEDWKISKNGFEFNEQTESNPYEFVVSRAFSEIRSALSVDKNGLKFYKKNKGSGAYIGQEVDLIKGQSYELAFNTFNPNPTEYSSQVIKYGVDRTMKTEKQTNRNKVMKKMTITPDVTGKKNIILGSEMTYYNFFGRRDTVMYFSDIMLINTDISAPDLVKVKGVEINSEGTVIKGSGEVETTIQALDIDRNIVLETNTDNNGDFMLSIPKQSSGTILHLINQDIKGNTSASVVLVTN